MTADRACISGRGNTTLGGIIGKSVYGPCPMSAAASAVVRAWVVGRRQVACWSGREGC